MKQLKSILALLLTLSLLLALGLTAYAEGETTYTLTITPKATDKGTHTYEAYQIFTGTLAVKDNKKILSDIVWGANVDQTKLGDLATAINTLHDPDLTGEDALTADSTASAFADAIAGLNATADGETAQAVAEAFAGVLKGNPAGTGNCNLGDTDETNNDALITNLPAGYYLVKDQDSSLANTNSAYTRYILQVLGDTELGAKNEVPSVDKKIQEGDTQVSANTASIGDSIPYVISSKVPDMTGYNKYYFVLNDTMSKGLTFNNDVVVKINGTALGTDAYTVTYSTDATTGVTTLKIVLKNFIQYNTATYKGKDITVTYSATLNEKAELGPAGNVNDVKLTYSNDPNFDYQGTDEPGPSEPKGETPKVEVKTFTTGIKLTKVDNSTPPQTLTGAKFSIAGDAVKVTLINREVYKTISGEPVDDNVWYMLKDGTYTKTAPTDATKDSYDSTTQKYAKITEVVETTKTEPVSATGYVNSSGVLTFEGLAAGTYTITELVAPEGYNKLSPDTIQVVITGNLNQDQKTCTWKLNSNDVTLDGNLIPLTVTNSSGNELPSTGGIGTTLFYVLGGLMVVGAGAVLIARRRAGRGD